MKNLTKYSLILKHLTRKGWMQKDISTPETVASHSWNMALLALYMSSQQENDYDFDKVIKLCLIHDLGESLIGDITPFEQSYQDKKVKEQLAIEQIAKDANFKELKVLFDEYEENKTKEAKLAHDLDQIDMFIQSLDYETKYSDKNLQEFRTSATSKITTLIGKKIIENLTK